MLVHEVLSRKLRDQRAVARYQTRTTGAKPSVRKTMIVALPDCKKTADGVIMRCGGRQVVHSPSIHQYLLCSGGKVETGW